MTSPTREISSEPLPDSTEKDFLLDHTHTRTPKPISSCTCGSRCKKCHPSSPLFPTDLSAAVGYGSISKTSFPAVPDSLNIAPGDVGASIRCACHVKVKDNTSRKARIKLVAACVIALAFMIGEVVGKCLCESQTVNSI